MQTFHDIAQLVKPYRWLLATLIGVATIGVALEGLGIGTVLLLLAIRGGQSAVFHVPWLGPKIHALAELSIEARIEILAGVLVGLTLLRSSVNYAEQLLGLRLRQKVESSLQSQIFDKFHVLSLQLLQSERRGSWMAILGQYTRQVGTLVLQFAQSVSVVVILVGYLVIAFAVSWRLALLTLVTLVPSGLLLGPFLNRRLKAASRATRDMLKGTQGIAQEQLRAMKIVRIYGQEEQSKELYAQGLRRYHDYEYRAGALSALAQPLLGAINMILLAGLLLIGVRYLPGSPEAILGQIVVFVTIAFRLTGPIGKLAKFQTVVVETTPMLQSIQQMLGDTYPCAPRSGDRPFAGLRERVELRALAFAYAPEEPEAIRDIQLEIPRRRITALVGGSGGGKSTIVSLLARLYDPTSGQVLVDGVDLRELKLGEWRQRIAVVSQEIVLFHATVWENLRFARADATDAEVVDAARRAHAHEFIAELPNGYDTVLQEEGMRLSGGQRQRIALARALLLDADLLILDEATSELDALTEQAIRQTIYAYAHDHAVLVIAHRLANVVDADHIYVLKEGTIIASGTHAELLAQNELYATMIQAQRAYEMNSKAIQTSDQMLAKLSQL